MIWYVTGVIVVLVSLYVYFSFGKKRQVNAEKLIGRHKGKLIVFGQTTQVDSNGVSIDMSPFVTKVEAYLNVANTPYIKKGAKPSDGPKNKIPFIAKPNGEIMGDSAFIYQYFQREIKDLDSDLNDEQVALTYTLSNLLDNSWYWVLVYHNWIHCFNQAAKRFKENLKGAPIPKPILFVLPYYVRYSANKALYGQGYGRHSVEELWQIGEKDIKTLSTFLGDKKYFFGNDRPRSLDCIVFGMLLPWWQNGFKSELVDRINKITNIVQFMERMKKDHWNHKQDLDTSMHLQEEEQ